MQSFTPGEENESLCLHIETVTDQDIEDREELRVMINSTDAAVRFINDTSVIAIEDANLGEKWKWCPANIGNWNEMF